MNQISASNNLIEVDMPLSKPNQTKPKIYMDFFFLYKIFDSYKCSTIACNLI